MLSAGETGANHIMNCLFSGSIALALAIAAQPGTAQDAASVAKAFGAREGISDISLSPDGSRVAMIVPTGARGQALLIADPWNGGTPTSIMRATGAPDHMSNCDWATNTRLVCNVFILSREAGAIEAFTRTISLDADGKDVKVVTARATDRSLYSTGYGGNVIDWTGDGQGSILMLRNYVPENSTGTHIASTREGLGVERVDVVTLARRPHEPPRRDAVEFITDGLGTVRVMGMRPTSGTGYGSNTISYYYRKQNSKSWEPLGKLLLEGSVARGFNPYAVDAKLNVVYGFDDANGRQALWRIALDGSLKRELVLSHPNVDVDQLLRIGRQRRVVGASFATDHREATYSDPELKALATALGRALPNRPIVSFADASTDERKLLIFTGSDIAPGEYYVFDKDTKRLAEVLPSRPELASYKLAEMKPVTFPAADGTQIPGYLTLPPGSDGKALPAIVMPHGGPSSRDEWGFDWWVQFFAARGFAVLQPNFRGSSGYGADWFKDNGWKSWRTAIGDVNDAGRWLVNQGIADPQKLAIVGWSYGGYAALQSPALAPDLFKAIIAVAPVTDLAMLKEDAANYWNYPQIAAMIGDGPHVREGSPARNARVINAPVLLFHGDLDQNVAIRASRLMASELRGAGKPVEFHEYKGVAHSLNDSAIRADMLTKSDAFLRKSLGM